MRKKTEKGKTIGSTSRREFMKITGAGAIGVMVGCSSGSGNGSGGPNGEGDGGGGGTDGGGSDVPKKRVVRVIDSGATSWKPGDSWTDYYQYGVQSVVDSMFEQGLTALSGKSTLSDAWKSLITYRNGDLVAIHVNAYCNNENGQKNNVYQVMSALVYGLVDVLGIPASQVAVVDSSHQLLGSPAQARLIDQCRHTAELGWDMYNGQFRADPIPFTSGHAPSGNVYPSKIMEDAAHVINVPVFSWHGGNWVTGALKNMMGETTGGGGPLHNGESYEQWGNGARLADICMPIRTKTRLVVGEGLFGNINGNTNPPHEFQTLGGDKGKHPSSTLYFTRDMVALDSVMYDDLLAEAAAEGSPKSGYQTGFLGFAADKDHNLGTFEMKALTGKGEYEKIELKDA